MAFVPSSAKYHDSKRKNNKLSGIQQKEFIFATINSIAAIKMELKKSINNIFKQEQMKIER